MLADLTLSLLSRKLLDCLAKSSWSDSCDRVLVQGIGTGADCRRSRGTEAGVESDCTVGACSTAVVCLWGNQVHFLFVMRGKMTSREKKARFQNVWATLLYVPPGSDRGGGPTLFLSCH